MKMTIIIITFIFIIFQQSVFAINKPRSLPTDKRIKVVIYQEDNVIPIHASTFITTQIIFNEKESIIDVENGDLSAWFKYINKSIPNILNIKPTILSSDTDLIVITEDNHENKRRYYFHLTSNERKSSDKNDIIYAIRFSYPKEKRNNSSSGFNKQKSQDHHILNAKRHPQDYNWDYAFHGERRIVPLHIFDNGQFTYMQFHPRQEIPAIFSVHNKKGIESVVNYRREGDYIVITEVAPQFTLRIGKYKVASIFNNKLIKNFHHKREV